MSIIGTSRRGLCRMVARRPPLSAIMWLGMVSFAWGYPSGPQITDRYTSGAISVRLVDSFVAPKSALSASAQIARLNFLRSEPVESLAARRCFANDMNGVLSIVDRATGTFTPYLNFDTVFNGVGSGDFDADPGYAAGLVTMQFDPAYSSNGKFYTVHTELGPGSTTAYRQAVLTEWQDTNINDGVFAGSRAELLRVQYVSGVHPLGDIGFNPSATDATHPDWRNMYVSSGDGGSGERDRPARDVPQRLDALAGKVLRIRADDRIVTGSYTVPADNPFASAPSGANPAVFALGLRNPHRLSWDTDDQGRTRGFIADIGLHSYEEINLLESGANYGYSEIEGNQVLGASNLVTDTLLPATLPLQTASGTVPGGIAPVYPLAMYSHRDGDAISGGFVYRGQAIPALRGKYVFGDIANGRLFYADAGEMLTASDADPTTMAAIHELNVFYDDPATLAGVQSRRVFDLVRDRWDVRNEAPSGSIGFVGSADGDRLPGSATSTGQADPYGTAYGGGRADIRFAELDGELYLISKSDGMVRRIANAIGDANFDGVVGNADLTVVAANYGSPGGFSEGDFDLSGRVDLDDLRLLASTYIAVGNGDISPDALSSLSVSLASEWRTALAAVPPPPTITIDVVAGVRTQAQASRPRLLGRCAVLKTGTGTLVIDRANTFTGTTHVQAGTVHLVHATGLAGSTLAPQAGGMVALSPALVASVAGVDIDSGGVVDIGTGRLSVRTGLSGQDAVAAIRSGENHGSSAGKTAIVSSQAESDATRGIPRTVGWLENSDGSIAFAYAAPGDSNIDACVDILDAANFMTGGRFDTGAVAAWEHGDFTHDGIVDILDAAGFFSTSLFDAGPYSSGPSDDSRVAAVPEPSELLLIAVSAGVALVRRLSRSRHR